MSTHVVARELAASSLVGTAALLRRMRTMTVATTATHATTAAAHAATMMMGVLELAWWAEAGETEKEREIGG